jgi:hypothetical protein
MASLIGQESVWEKCRSLLNMSCHLFITGPPGSGKTTLMKELLQEYAQKTNKRNVSSWGEEANDECMFLSPEQDRGIQTIRGQVSLFIRQMAPHSINGATNWRWVIIDDVDTFPQISQQALRRPMETHCHITRFIFIGNSIEDLIPAIQSRCIHVTMNLVFPMFSPKKFLSICDYTPEEQDLFVEDMWSWVMNVSQNNIADTLRLLRLVHDVAKTLNTPLTLKLVQTLCSVPFHVDFVPLLGAMQMGNYVNAAKALIHVWKRGYTFEDIIESFQSIHEFYGDAILSHNVRIHTFLVNAWIAYCKGNTSILALQSVLYKTFTQTDVPLFDSEMQSIATGPFPVST